MKTLIVFLLSVSITLAQSVIKVNAGTDTVNIAGVSMIIKHKAHHTLTIFDEFGAPLRVMYILKAYAFDGTTELGPSGSDVDRELIKAREVSFEITGRYINTVTKKYTNGGGQNEVLLSEYLRTKAINTYPGVANADPLSDLVQGILREIISIKQANKELNN